MELSSRVLFGNAVPIVYGRVRFSGRELSPKLSAGTQTPRRGHLRVNEVPNVLNCVGEVHPAYHP